MHTRLAAALARWGWSGLLGSLALLSACVSPPGAPAAGTDTTASASPAHAPTPVDTSNAAAPSAPAVTAPPSLTVQESQRAVAAALEALQGGQEELAESELRRVLLSDPGHRLAQSLLRQIRDDPVAVLGRESWPYRVKPGESLSIIAQRVLGDAQQFYLLARYNGIKVPRALAGGQVIKLPGKAPAAAAAAVTGTAMAVEAKPTEAAVRAERQRTEAVTRHIRTARTAFARQDLDGALRAWDAVLALEPDNRTAQLERQRVLGLKDKLGKLK